MCWRCDKTQDQIDTHTITTTLEHISNKLYRLKQQFPNPKLSDQDIKEIEYYRNDINHYINKLINLKTKVVVDPVKWM